MMAGRRQRVSPAMDFIQALSTSSSSLVGTTAMMRFSAKMATLSQMLYSES